MSSYESWLDAQIRQAQERGDFDDLPGSGKPLPDRGETYDEDWWIKQWVRREEITGVVPTSLKVKKEAEELMTTLAAQSSEAAVRRIVAELNQRIDRVRRGHVDGPPVILEQFDVDAVVEAWRRGRDESAAA
jgi:DnaJ homologue, subfamily C, member 28, conserved domain